MQLIAIFIHNQFPAIMPGLLPFLADLFTKPMARSGIMLLVLLNNFLVASSQEFIPNYDESKVAPYTLPDPLSFISAKSVTSTGEWTKRRAPEILKLFSENVYGSLPRGPKSTRFEVVSKKNDAVNGKAIAKQVRIYFGNSSEYMDMLLYTPVRTSRPVPVFIGLNFMGNQTVLDDPWIPLTTRWVGNNTSYGISDNKTNERTRGAQSTRWCVEMLMDAGFGLATAYYGDLEPDYPEGWKTGIRTTLQSSTGLQPEQWGAIGAWGWGLSRMMDYLETDKMIDAKKVVITGHSRLGKAALWAAANDRRFALVVSNESGEGGAALARRNYGETVQRITTVFPHWFVAKYSTYGQDPSKLPVDQHMLLSLLAPRPLYVASAQDDQWADPYGEFLSAYHAGPVYDLFGKKGLGTERMPAPEEPVGDVIRYHMRKGEHDIKPYDWQQFITFAKQHLLK
jgi:hypothetical protein